MKTQEPFGSQAYIALFYGYYSTTERRAAVDAVSKFLFQLAFAADSGYGTPLSSTSRSQAVRGFISLRSFAHPTLQQVGSKLASKLFDETTNEKPSASYGHIKLLFSVTKTQAYPLF